MAHSCKGPALIRIPARTAAGDVTLRAPMKGRASMPGRKRNQQMETPPHEMGGLGRALGLWASAHRSKDKRSSIMKIRAYLVCSAAIIAGPSFAMGQIVFHDDFSGNALGPHWQTFHDPVGIQHSVGGERLTVNHIPNPPGLPGASAYGAVFRASFDPHVGDFHAAVRLGWEPGAHRQVWVVLSEGATGRRAALMTYSELSGRVTAQMSAGTIGTPAPSPGNQLFEITRIGSEVHFALNGHRFATMPKDGPVIDRLRLQVNYFHPGQRFEPVYFESVLIVPAPATALAPLLAGLLAMRRRR